MARIELTAEDSALIATRIAEFANSEESSRGLVGSDALLIYGDIGGVIGIRPSGELVVGEHNEPDASGKVLDDPFWVRMALACGAKHFPELRHLIPSRTVGALTCEACKGTGTLAGFSNMICYCGGVGWIDKHRPK